MYDQLIGAGINVHQGAQDKKDAERQRAAYIDYVNKLDFAPQQASSVVPDYQRSKSPISRSFMDSLVMGNNPAAVNPVSPNAALKTREAQGAQNQMFGTPEARANAQRRMMDEQPWALKGRVDDSALRKPLPKPDKKKTNKWTKIMSTLFDPADFRGSGEDSYLRDTQSWMNK